MPSAVNGDAVQPVRSACGAVIPLLTAAGVAASSDQPLREKFHHALSCLVRRMAVLLAHLVRQHRVRYAAEAVLIAPRRVELDHLEGVAEPPTQRRESLTWHQGITGEPQT